MPACDGSKCTKSVPWRITLTGLQMSDGTVPFSVETAYLSLVSVLSGWGCESRAPRNKPVVFKNLCKSCWDAQAALWGDVGTYTTARAKTTPDAIYMQVARPDFEINKRYDKEAILSCATHELMHYWSDLGVGLQNYNRRANVDWDEAVADCLGFLVYTRLYRGQVGFRHYVTPYNTYCQFLTRAQTYFGNVFGRLWREPSDAARLPKPVADAIARSKATQPPPPLTQAKVPAAELLSKTLAKYLFTWFFSGPSVPIRDHGTKVDIERFLDGNYLSNMFAVSQVFQAYDGSNTLHPI